MDKLYFELRNFNEQSIISDIDSITISNLLSTEEHPKGFNFLHAASYYGFDKLLLVILEKTEGEGLNYQDNFGRTPIHHLASNGRTQSLETILENYPDQIEIEKTNYKGRTALHSAAKHVQHTVVEQLLSYGANQNAIDIHGHTPLSLLYHRHYPGEGISFSPLVTKLINRLGESSTYWTSKFTWQGDDNQNTILLAWHLGMKYAHDPHWIPGITLCSNLQSEPYIIKDVYQTSLTKFVIITHGESALLLCLDQTHTLQKPIALNHHLTANYLDEIELNILPNLQSKNISIVWGAELAGIDAQIIASKLFGTSLLLINSPGLPENLLSGRLSYPDSLVCFYSTQDILHLQGKYHLAKENRNFFYTDVVPEEQINDESLLEWALHDLNRNKAKYQAPDLIVKTNYIEGCVYSSTEEQKLGMLSAQDTSVDILFDNTSQSIERIKKDNHPAELENFARYEYCAHGLAYLHLPHEKLAVKWWGNSFLLPIYQVIHHQGLYAYLLIQSKKWILSFQGTDPLDSDSVRRDLDRGSAGIKRMRQQHLQIIDILANRIEKTEDVNLQLIICGHSLGGADAQNFFTSLVAFMACAEPSRQLIPSQTWFKFIARNQLRNPLESLRQKISGIHLYAYNAAGIRETTASLATASTEILKESHIEITVNHQRVRHDVVNTVGETTLYKFSEGTTHVRSLFFKGHKDMIERVKTSHTDRQFYGRKIGQYTLFQGQDGQSHIQSNVETLGGKIEPKSDTYNEVKKFLQQGNMSQRYNI